MKPDMIIALVSLNIFGWLYGYGIVRTLRRRSNPGDDHGQTAWLVVIGVAVVGIAFALVTTIDQAVTLFLLFAAAGIPMVVEYTDSHTDLIRRQRLASFLASLDSEEEHEA